MSPSFEQKIAIGLGYFSTYIGLQGVAALALPYYQMEQGLDPFLLGVLLSLPVLVGALCTNLLMRGIKQFLLHFTINQLMLWLGWFVGLVFLTLWLVPDSWPETLRLALLFGLFLFYSLILNVLIIVLKILTFSLAKMNRDNSIFNSATFAEKIGSILYFWLFPLATLTIWENLEQGVIATGLIVGICVIGVTSSIMAKLLPNVNLDSRFQLHNSQDTVEHKKTERSLEKQITTLMLVVWLQFGVVGLCVGVDYYLLVYFVEQGNIAAGSNLKAILSSAYAIAGILYIPVLKQLKNALNLTECLLVVALLAGIGSVLKWFIFTPEGSDFLVLDALFGAAIWTAMTMTVPSMLTHFSRVDTRIQIENLVAKHHIVVSSAVVFASVVSGLILNLIGFSSELLIQEQHVIPSLRIVLSVGSLFVTVLMIFLLMKINKWGTEQENNYKRGKKIANY